MNIMITAIVTKFDPSVDAIYAAAALCLGTPERGKHLGTSATSSNFTAPPRA